MRFIFVLLSSTFSVYAFVQAPQKAWLPEPPFPATLISGSTTAPPASSISIRRWNASQPGSSSRLADGVQSKTFMVDDVEIEATIAASGRQYWIYLAVTNHGRHAIDLRPESFQLMAVEPYERLMTYRPPQSILLLTRRLASGDVPYLGPQEPSHSLLTPAASPDYRIMDRIYRQAEKASPSDPTDLAYHLEDRLLEANAIAPGQRSAGFLLYEMPQPRALKKGLLEAYWEPDQLLLSIRIGGQYVQIPLEPGN